jgi:DNA-binding beta-propeller fold protein YncE
LAVDELLIKRLPIAACRAETKTLPMSYQLSRCLMTVFVCVLFLTPARADKVVLVAGGGAKDGDGHALEVKLQGPFGVDFDKAGNLYFVEMLGHRVGRVDAKGILTFIAGTGKKGDAGDNGPALKAEFNSMHCLAVGPAGNIFLADTWNNRVRKIDAKTGQIANFAGTGAKGFSGDGGPADKAQFGGVYCIAFDPRGEQMYIADLDNYRIRAIDMKTGIVRTVAGNGEKGVPADRAEAIKAPLLDPRAVAADAKANIYILERGGHALRVVDANGRIHTVAGTGKQGATGDGGDARLATFNGPKHLCIDRDGNVLIADTENHAIRRYIPDSGKIVRVAGTGAKGSAGVAGPPDKVELSQPHGVFAGPQGEIFIADSSNNRILKITR